MATERLCCVRFMCRLIFPPCKRFQLMSLWLAAFAGLSATGCSGELARRRLSLGTGGSVQLSMEQLKDMNDLLTYDVREIEGLQRLDQELASASAASLKAHPPLNAGPEALVAAMTSPASEEEASGLATTTKAPAAAPAPEASNSSTAATKTDSKKSEAASTNKTSSKGSTASTGVSLHPLKSVAAVVFFVFTGVSCIYVVRWLRSKGGGAKVPAATATDPTDELHEVWVRQPGSQRTLW